MHQLNAIISWTFLRKYTRRHSKDQADAWRVAIGLWLADFLPLEPSSKNVKDDPKDDSIVVNNRLILI